jgi:DNA (cytosine-5)-methyltransferase 1
LYFSRLGNAIFYDETEKIILLTQVKAPPLTTLALASDSAAKPVPNHTARRVGAEVQKRIDALKIGQKMQDLPEELWHDSFRFYVKHDPNRQGGPNLRMIRLDPNKPSLTVTGYIFNKFVHPYENRFITVREAARLQGFPDDLKFEGTLTSTQLQVGNAVPIPLAKAVFENLAHQAQSKGFENRPLKAFSLFSGAGGMDIGAHLTGCIETRVTLDNWSDACATLRGFFGAGNQVMGKQRVCILEQDISTVENPLRLWQEASGEVVRPDIVYGGPPCQAFSQAGKQKGIQDCRGAMIFEFLRFVEYLKPSFFVMENVSNLKGIAGGKLYQDILEKMTDLGYNISVGLLVAADFGTPQLRRRLFFQGCRSDIGRVSLPLPTHSPELELFNHLPYVTVSEALVSLPEAEFSR